MALTDITLVGLWGQVAQLVEHAIENRSVAGSIPALAISFPLYDRLNVMDAELTPENLIWAYTHGVFPMADTHDGAANWYTADPRATLPLDRFHVPRSLAKFMRREPFVVTRDRAFEAVIRGCAEPRPYADETWINAPIIDAFCQLHDMGFAHSVEAWSHDDPSKLLGGIYGIAIGGAFFGESMFSRVSNASKVCLAQTVRHLRERGFVLFDVQFTNAHLTQFGIEEISAEVYQSRLDAAVQMKVSW